MLFINHNLNICAKLFLQCRYLFLLSSSLDERHFAELADVLRGAIEAGGDTDTIASMTGQIAGAWIGASRIPREMIELLPEARMIEGTAEEFAATVEA
jgi:hypothetical protein